MIASRAVTLLLLLGLTLLSAAFISGQGANPCVDLLGVFDEESGDCISEGSIEMSVALPGWLSEYPNAQAAVAEFHIARRTAFFAEVAEYSIVQANRPLGFGLSYDEMTFTDDVVTLTLYAYENYAGAYPLSSLHTVTIDRAADRVLGIGDLFLDDTDIIAVLQPYVEDQLGEENMSYIFFDEAAWDDPATYNTFMLSDADDGMLTLLYPVERIGPANPGTLPVVIPLAALNTVLQPRFRVD